MKIPHAFALVSFSLAALGCSATNIKAPPYPTLKKDGIILTSVCVPPQLRQLKEQFARYKYKDEEEAWKAVITLLCGSTTEENTRYVRYLMAPKLVSTSDYTGQDNQPETINSDEEAAANLLTLGIAYDATIANLPGAMFRVLFTTNEVCGASRTFKYIKNKWMIVSIGEACD